LKITGTVIKANVPSRSIRENELCEFAPSLGCDCTCLSGRGKPRRISRMTLSQVDQPDHLSSCFGGRPDTYRTSRSVSRSPYAHFLRRSGLTRFRDLVLLTLTVVTDDQDADSPLMRLGHHGGSTRPDSPPQRRRLGCGQVVRGPLRLDCSVAWLLSIQGSMPALREVEGTDRRVCHASGRPSRRRFE